MKEELKSNDNLKSEIVKIESIHQDLFKVYFNFLNIPVQVNRDFLNTIIDGNPERMYSHIE